MQLMDDAIQHYYDQGEISGQEAYMKSIDKARFLPFFEKEVGKGAAGH
jgi:hypothetical protein